MAIRLPLALYRLGLGMVIGAAPIMVLTTRGRKSGLPRHTALEYRQHGSKFYVISGWGQRADWLQNLLADPNVTIQCGQHTFAARARVVEDAGEANRVVQLYRKQLPYIYDTLLSKVSGETSVNPRRVMEVSDKLTIVRMDRLTDVQPSQPPLQPDLVWVLPVTAMVMTATLGLIVAARTRRS